MNHELAVAVEIADAILAADRANRTLDVERTTGYIATRHPGSGVSRKHIAAALTEESEAAGVESE